MGVVVPVGEYTATFVFNCDGISKDITWSLGFTTVNLDTLGGMAQEIYDIWTSFTGSDWVPMSTPVMSDQWVFAGVVVARQTETGPLVGQYLDGSRGAVSTDPMPVNCAVLATKNTALGGRKNRGRAYLPPFWPTEGYVNGAGQVDSSFLELGQENYDRAMTSMETAGYVPVLHHSDGSDGTPITSLTIGGTIATQRRRLR